MAKGKEIIETGMGCLAMPLMLCGFAIIVASLPLCVIIGLAEIVIYCLIGLILKPLGLNIFQDKISNPAFIVGIVVLVIALITIYFVYPNIFFNLLLFGDDYFPRLKP